MPQFDTYACRLFIHQLMQSFAKATHPRPVGMVADRSGIHRAKALPSTLQPDQGRFRLPLLPARAGHPLNPIEGFWRVMKDTLGAGRCFDNRHRLYQRTRRVLLTHHKQPIYRFSWTDYASNLA